MGNLYFKSVWLIFLFSTAMATTSFAQSIGIGTVTPNTSAALDLTSTKKGLLIPRMSSARVLAILQAAKGLIVYDSSQNQVVMNRGSSSSPNWQTVAASSEWALSGNQGTNVLYNFIGQLSDSPLVFKVNNIIAGYISDGPLNTSFGAQALGTLPNVASGNTAFGNIALVSNSTGVNNVAGGFYALYGNTEGTENLAIGVGALAVNTTGVINIGIGNFACSGIQTANVNIGIGFNALAGNIYGIDNTVVGNSADLGSSFGKLNTLFGYNTGNNVDMGSDNTILGANSSMENNTQYNDVAIGQATICTASNQVRLGNSATYSIGGFADWTKISDGRYKSNIREEVKGLGFIMKLRPINYRLRVSALSQRLHEHPELDRGAHMKKAIDEKETSIQTGFIAQEAEQAAIASGFTFSGIEIPDKQTGLYGLRYAAFVVPLIKAMQEQQQIIENLGRRMDALLTQNMLLMQQLVKQNKQP